jgi:TolB-like protein
MSSINCLNKAVVLLFAAIIGVAGCALKGPSAAAGRAVPGNKLSIAVFPVENLSMKAAPLKEMRQALIKSIAGPDVSVLGDEEIERFMARHRVRYAGGIDTETAQSLKKEVGADAVLITSLEQYSETAPPQAAVISRLVSTGDPPLILWMDIVGMAGDDNPGLLGLGLINDPRVLWEKVLRRLGDSFERYRSGKNHGSDQTAGKKRFQPKILFRSSSLPRKGTATIAVTPFFNSSDRKNAGELMVLHLVKELANAGNFSVIEPGVLRRKLLNFRFIMNEGLSLADEDLIAQSLGVDFIFTGEVLSYQDDESARGRPKVDFFAMAIERLSKKVIWASESYNQGDDGVFFFDCGKVNTASSLASEMARSLVEKISEK